MRPGEKAHPRESPPPAPDPTEENVSYPGNRPATNAAIGSGGLRGRSAKKRMIRAAYRPSPTSEVGKISSRQDAGTSGRVRRMRCSAARSARTMPLCPPRCPLRPLSYRMPPAPRPVGTKAIWPNRPGCVPLFFRENPDRRASGPAAAFAKHRENLSRKTADGRPETSGKAFPPASVPFCSKKKRHFAR